jgi:acylphosphatase
MRKQARLTITGIVQGVGFRAYTLRQARILGVYGYVRNLASGGVEIVAEGSEDAIERLIQWARKGPPLSRVEDVKIEIAEPTEDHSDFSIWH